MNTILSTSAQLHHHKQLLSIAPIENDHSLRVVQFSLQQESPIGLIVRAPRSVVTRSTEWYLQD